ncbi:hypothetical protein [Fibrobacter sp. UBA4297]|uniref:hypothetical protein n=1 Tax=Fibrobacter sp. UBA4297 TaxID=1946536 RepID=UPI0025BCE59B|nr:hypothetical protein [Fibrobacter sp. UBA4297]
MNKKKLLALLVSSAFLFAACGDDDSPSSPKNNQEEVSSSSEEDDCDSDECEVKSSSSKTEDKKSSDSKDDDKKSSDSKDNKSSDSKSESNSSSSAKDEAKSSSSAETPNSSSSADAPKGARAAKLADLEKNYELKIFDQTVYLSTGSKQGLIALRILDEMWLVTYTDFANGEVKFVDGNVGKQYAETDGVKKILEQLKAKDGFTLSFIVDKDNVVKYAVNGSKEYSEAVKTSVAVTKGKVSKAADIQNKIFECTDGDTTRTFTFFDNSYIVENAADGKVAYWIGGHYDIQRSTLLMRPAYYNKPVYSMYTYSVGTDNKISSSNGETKTTMSCDVEASEYEYEKASDFVGEWQAKKDNIDWKFTLKADGTYEISGFDGTKNVESKEGVWEIYGYHLMMRNKGCLHPDKCTTSIHGQLQAGPTDRNTNKISGFSFVHHDPDTPKIPTSFEAPQYE